MWADISSTPLKKNAATMTKLPEKPSVKEGVASKAAGEKSDNTIDLDGHDQFLDRKLEPAIVTQSIQFSGPIPHPSILKKYDDIIPGLANRIVSMAELDQHHIHKMECKSLDQPHQYAILTNINGAVVAIVGIASSAYVTVNGYPWAGAALFSATLAGIVIAFIKSRRGGDTKNEASTPAPKPRRKR